MKRTAIALILLVFPSLLRAAPVDLEKIRQKYNLPALGSLFLGESGDSSWVAGIRKWGNSTKAEVSDKFHLGSDTKAMTATLVAIYVERGLLKWEATLPDLFPELRSLHADYRKVTLQLLTAHHSGITGDLNSFQGGSLAKKIWDPKLAATEGRKLVAQEILSAPADHSPDKEYVYSNLNYVIVGAVLEKISGKSWEELMRQEIFIPLKMESCGFGVQATPDQEPPRQPWPHRFLNSNPVAIAPDFYADNPPTIGPAGTVHCNMADWAKFIRVHLDGAVGKDTSILKASGFLKLHESYPDKSYTYGGWKRVGNDEAYALTHAGSNGMNFANVWIFPKRKFAGLAVTNIGGDPASAATDQVIAELIKLLAFPSIYSRHR